MGSPVLRALRGDPVIWVDSPGFCSISLSPRRRTSANLCRISTARNWGANVQKCGFGWRGCNFMEDQLLFLSSAFYDRSPGGFRVNDMKISCSHRNENVPDRSGEGRISGQLGKENKTKTECIYLKRTVCEGEVVEHPGSVIILGDVKHGGCVSAGGDVIVLGRLQGHAHAGTAGDHTAKVFAVWDELGTVKIGDQATLQLPTNENSGPLFARLAPDGTITIHRTLGEVSSCDNSCQTELGSPTVDKMKFSKDSGSQTAGFRKKKPAQVALVTGIYISVAGLALLAFPKFLFGIFFSTQGVSLGWIQVVAVLAVVFGIYYLGTAIGDLRGINGAQAFYYSTVVGRTFLFLSFTTLVVTGAVPSALLLVGAVNLVGALLMWKALAKQKVV